MWVTVVASVPVLVTPMVLFSGLLYDRTTVSPWLRWIQDTSLVNYTYTALVLNQCRSDQYITNRCGRHG